MSNTQTARPAEYGLQTIYGCESGPKQLPSEDLQHALYEPFLDTTHSTLQIYDHAGSTQPTPFPILLRVYNANDGTSIPFALKSVDTIGKLQRCYQKMRPELVGRLNLAYNGKPVPALKTLGELGVKPGATFITYQKVTGGPMLLKATLDLWQTAAMLDSPVSGQIPLHVFDGSTGTKIPPVLKITDTVDQLKQMLKEENDKMKDPGRAGSETRSLLLPLLQMYWRLETGNI